MEFGVAHRKRRLLAVERTEEQVCRHRGHLWPGVIDTRGINTVHTYSIAAEDRDTSGFSPRIPPCVYLRH